MRRQKRTAILIILLFIFSAACSSEKQIVIIQGPKHEDNRKISEPGKVGKVKNIIEKANWENTKVDIRPPEYRLGFQKNEANPVFYNVWVDADNNRLSLTQGNRYVLLSKENSADLFNLMKGK